jgi:hypothetical protein
VNSELIIFGGADRPPLTRQEREEARRAAVVKGQVRHRRLQADGALALGAHVMDGLKELDNYRKQQAGDDVDINLLLGEIEAMTIRQVKHIQAALYDGWGA